MAELLAYLPMPIGEKTISEAVKYSQRKPGKCGEQECDQVPLPRWSRDPAEHIEDDQRDVKKVEELVRKQIEFQIQNFSSGSDRP